MPSHVQDLGELILTYDPLKPQARFFPTASALAAGLAVPVQDLWKQIIDETQCSLVITTGTAGGIGSNVKLGDVIVGRHTVFDCNTKFKNKPFAHTSFPTSPVQGKPFTAVTKAMLK